MGLVYWGYVASLIALVVQSFTIVLLSLRVDALKEHVRELQGAYLSKAEAIIYRAPTVQIADKQPEKGI